MTILGALFTNQFYDIEEFIGQLFLVLREGWRKINTSGELASKLELDGDEW